MISTTPASYLALGIGLYACQTPTTPTAVRLAQKLAAAQLIVAFVPLATAFPEALPCYLEWLPGVTIHHQPRVALYSGYDVVVIDAGPRRMNLPAHWVNLDNPDHDTWWLVFL